MNSRNTKLNGNTISNSAVNLGDHATVSNKVRQETGNQEQLKTLLAELHTLISNSNASPTVRNEATQHAESNGVKSNIPTFFWKDRKFKLIKPKYLLS